MAKFLSRHDIYRCLSRELPEDVYPDGAPETYYSTADMDSIADVGATAYANLERIYDNYFPQTADEKQSDWELKVFGYLLASDLTLAERRDRVIGRIRERKDLTLWTILTAVLEYVPTGTEVQLWEWCHWEGGQWKLNLSRLNVDTILGLHENYVNKALNYCDPSEVVDYHSWRLGLNKLNTETALAPDPEKLFSPIDWFNEQKFAYAYEVRIFGYTLTPTQRTDLDNYLKQIEPARSYHYIKDGLVLSDYGLDYTVTNVGQFDNLNCLYKDTGSTTGYSGRSTDG